MSDKLIMQRDTRHKTRPPPPPQGKLPTRITVPLSVLNQPLKTKSVVTSPMVKGSLNTR